MKKIITMYTLVVLGVVSTTLLWGQTPTSTPADNSTVGLLDTFKGRAVVTENRHVNQIDRFYFGFRIGEDILREDHKNNSHEENRVFRMIDTMDLAAIDSIIFVGSASPDGRRAFNESLASRRASSVRSDFFGERPALMNIRNRVYVLPASWEEVAVEIEENAEVPNKRDVLATIHSSQSAEVVSTRLKVNFPTAFRYLQANTLSDMRDRSVCVVFYISDKTPPPVVEAPVEVVPVIVADTIVLAPVILPADTIRSVVTEVVDTVYAPVVERKPLFAIKTNLLFDVATLLNLEVEVPIGKRYSVAGELIFPWWLVEAKQNCLQLFSANLEGRYWFGNREMASNGKPRGLLTGWFAGVHVGGGYYDLEWASNGYQGEFYIAFGVSGGYAHSIGRNLRMEYSLGIGYMQTNYRHYNAKQTPDGDWRLYRQSDGKFSWFGPTRAKVSLVWMINYKKRHK